MRGRRFLSILLTLCMLFTGLMPGMTAEARHTGQQTQVQAGETVIDVTDFGADPTGIQDSAQAIIRAVEKAKEAEGPTVINFPEGEYQIYPDKAQERELYISNTVGADQAYKMKKIGILLEDMENVTVEGNGSLFLFHGKMTTFAAIRCKNVKFQNFSVDFQVPTVVDITVEAVEGNSATVYIPECYNYEIDGTSIVWKSDVSPYTGQTSWTGRNGFNYTQIYDLKTGLTLRGSNPLFSGVSSIEDLGNHRVRFQYGSISSAIQPGLCYQMRPTVRDHAGTFFWQDQNVELTNLNIHFLHGFGMVGQSTENVHLNGVRFEVPEGSGRTTAGYADFIQMSGCKGEIRMENCSFSNPHDDPINIHGTFLQVVERISPNQFKVRYMHNETAGFPNFFVGDQVEFMTQGNMIPVENSVATVTEVSGPTGESGASESGTGSLTDIVITLDRDMPEEIQAGTHVVENITYTPSVVIENNLFKETPTRGILVTTRKKVEIRNNEFDGMGMAAIYISNDAQGWYESGPVRDVVIEDNVFRRCSYQTGAPVIFVEPTNPTVSTEQTVHENIAIQNNTFYMEDNQVLNAKSVKNLSFTGNRIYRYDPNVRLNLEAEQTQLQVGEALSLNPQAEATSLNSNLFSFNGCKEVSLEGNLYDGGLKKNVSISNMDSGEVAQQEEEGLVINGGENQTSEVGTLTYESSDESVRTVSSSGIVRAVGEGNASIVLVSTVGGRRFTSDPVTFTVTAGQMENQPESVTITSDTETVTELGAQVSYQAQVLPESAESQISWSVQDPVTGEESAHAEIDENGQLTALSNGVVRITAATQNGLEAYKLLVIQAEEVTLGDSLEVVNENPDHWSITGEGRIQIQAHAQGLWDTQTVHNIIVSSPQTDLTNVTATVRMHGKTQANYDEAGLIFYQDNDNYVTAQRKHGGGSPYLSVVTESEQNPSENSITDSSLEDIWLKLEKTGDRVIGSYSEDGSQWTPIREVTNASLGSSFRIGMVAGSGSDSGTPFEFSELTINGVDVPLTKINQAPKAAQVTASYDPETKHILAGYEYSDAQNDAEGRSLVLWMAAEEQEGAYRLLSGVEGADISAPQETAGRYVKAVVIPQDLAGMYGAPVVGESVFVEEAGDVGKPLANTQTKLQSASFNGVDGFAAFDPQVNSYLTRASSEQKEIQASFGAKDRQATLEVSLNGKVQIPWSDQVSETKDLTLKLLPGWNVIEAKVLAADGETREVYRFVIMRQGYDEKTLQGIRLNGELLEGFDAEQTTYVYLAPRGSESIEVEAVGAHESARVAIFAGDFASWESRGTVPLKPGSNQIQIRVRPDVFAPDNLYQILVKVPSDANGNLERVELGSGVTLTETFRPEHTDYTGEATKKRIPVTFTAEEAQARIAVTAGKRKLGEGTGSVKTELPIHLGVNEILITVTSPDQTVSREYRLHLNGKESVYLSDLNYDASQSSSGYGVVANRDLSTDGNPLTLLDEQGALVTFEKGVGTHAEASLVYDIKELGFETFSTYLGIDQEITDKSQPDVVFQIYVDENLCYESDVMTGTTPMAFAEVSVKDASTLRLVAKQLTYNYSDHVDFADARFTTGLEEEKEIYQVRYKATPAYGGETKALYEDKEDTSGAFQAEEGTQITLIAQAADGYRFAGWYQENGAKVSLQEEYIIRSLNKNASYEARFERTSTPSESYTIRYEATAGGTVKGSLNGAEDTTGSIRAEEGSLVTLSAQAEEGCRFVGWYDQDGKKVSGSSVFTIRSVWKDGFYQARFEESVPAPRMITIRYQSQLPTLAPVKAAYEGLTDTDGEIRVPEKTGVTLTVMPAAGYRFAGWYNQEGTQVSEQLSYTMEAAKDDTLTARFEREWTPVAEKYTILAMTDTPGGTVDGSVTVEKGGSVTLTATVNEGYEFAGWFRDGKKLSDMLTLTVTKVSQDAVYVARFTKKTVQEPQADSPQGQNPQTQPPVQADDEPGSQAEEQKVQKPARPVLSRRKKGKSSVILKWKCKGKVQGFQIQRKTGKGSYKTIRNLSGKKRSWKATGLKKGKIYRFRIRSYRKANGKKVYSRYSKEIRVKMK